MMTDHLTDDPGDIIAWKLAEMGGNRCHQDLSQPNRFISLDLATRYLYHTRSDDLIAALLAHGYRIVRTDDKS